MFQLPFLHFLMSDVVSWKTDKFMETSTYIFDPDENISNLSCKKCPIVSNF